MTVSFAQLNLNDSLIEALEKAGYKTPTDIQVQAIPELYICKDNTLKQNNR